MSTEVEQGGHYSLIPSPMEQQVLTYIAQGLTTKQMAERMYQSPITINGYRDRLLKRLGASNSAHLMVIAAQRGLIPLEDE